MEFINNYFDKIIFIHCAHRKDRYENIQNLLKKTGITNYHILKATYLKNGAKGCSHSHYRALELARVLRWKKVLILEDDFQFWDNVGEIDNKFKKIIELTNDDWDVIQGWWLMNAYKKRSEKVNEYLRKPTHKKYKAASTVCYSVNNKRDIMKRLRNVFLKSYNNFSETFYQSEKKYSLDCMWYPLQEKYKWYFIEDKIGYHINTKSDINYIIK